MSSVVSLPTGQPCPCGRPAAFEACCGAIIASGAIAGTAEDLMRSRYTAHVIRDYAYLHRTYRETASRPYVKEVVDDPIVWTRLTIHSHEPEVHPGVSFVEFSAFFQEDGNERELRERSEFKRVNGAWLYTRTVRSGPPPVRTAGPKVGRNDPCPCGSGKKHKHCCLAA
jgi:SEC-C motif-containing protein